MVVRGGDRSSLVDPLLRLAGRSLAVSALGLLAGAAVARLVTGGRGTAADVVVVSVAVALVSVFASRLVLPPVSRRLPPTRSVRAVSKRGLQDAAGRQ